MVLSNKAFLYDVDVRTADACLLPSPVFTVFLIFGVGCKSRKDTLAGEIASSDVHGSRWPRGEPTAPLSPVGLEAEVLPTLQVHPDQRNLADHLDQFLQLINGVKLLAAVDLWVR